MSMTRLAVFAAALSLFASHAVPAQALKPAPPIAGDSTAVPGEVEFAILAEWQVGDEYRIDYSAERINRRNGKLETQSSWAVITARVEEKTPDGYVVVWANKDVGLDGRAPDTHAKANEIEGFLLEMGKNLRTEIVTADTGFPTGLRNTDEMMSRMKSMLERILGTLESQPEKQARLRSVMQQNLTARFVETRGLMDAYLVYGLMGGTCRGGHVDTYDTDVPFPFGGPPIPATLHVLLREYDEQAGRARITVQQIPDATRLNEAMEKWMTRTAESIGRPVPEQSQIPRLIMQDTTEYLFDFEMGLPREVTSEKYVGVEGSTDVRIDRRTYRITPLP